MGSAQEQANTEAYEVEGDLLICRAGGCHLPHQCVVTGEPSFAHHRIERSLSFTPRWFYPLAGLAILGGLLAMISRSIPCSYSLGRGGRVRGAVYQLFSLLTLIGGAIAACFGVNHCFESVPRGVAILAGALILFYFSGFCHRHYSPLRIVRHKKGAFYVKGIHPSILDQFQDSSNELKCAKGIRPDPSA